MELVLSNNDRLLHGRSSRAAMEASFASRYLTVPVSYPANNKVPLNLKG